MKIPINSKNPNQDMLSLASSNADLTYVVKNGSNESEIKSFMNQNKYKFIEPVDNLKTSEKIELYNMLSTDMQSLL